MRTTKYPLILVVLLLWAWSPAFAQTPVVNNQAGQVTEFEVNGLKVILKRREAAPTFAGGLFFRGGVLNQTEENAGIENLTLAAATEGGRRFSRQQLRRELSRMGGAPLAGGGSRDYGVISFASTTENFTRVWEIFTDVAVEPTFLPADVERIRQQMLSGLREAETSPDGALQTAQERVVYRGHPYSVSPSGTLRTVSGISVNDLKEYHRGLMQTSRMLLVVVGDIEPEALKTKVTASFGKLPRGEYKENELPPLDFSEPSVDISPRTIQTNYIQGAFAAPALSHPDYYAMRVATTILQQLVYEEVRVKRQLSYAPNAELDNFSANTGKIYVTAVQANEAVRVMREQIDMLRTRLTNEDFIAGMAGQFLTYYYLDQQTNAAQAAELARYELIGGGWRRSLDFLDRMRAVTPQDVQRVSEKYFTNFRFVVIGDPGSVDKKVFLGLEQDPSTKAAATGR